MIRSVATGFTAHFRAFRLLVRNRKIRRLAAIPFVVNTLLFVVGIPLVIWWGAGYVDSLFGGGTWWVEALTVVAQIILTLLVIVVAIFLFTLIGTLVTGPFTGPLSEAVERYERERRGKLAKEFVSGGVVRDTGRSLLFTFGRLLLFVAFYPFIFATQFIPVVGFALYPILAILYATFVLSVDFSDPTLDRHIKGFRAKLRYVWTRKGLYFGFGIGAVGLMLIPFFNLAVIPVCVVGATMLYVEEDVER